MNPSTSTADATAVQEQTPGVLVLRSQTVQGVAADSNGHGAPCSFGQPCDSHEGSARPPRDLNAPHQAAPEKWGHAAANSPMSELAELMQEPPGGQGRGRSCSIHPDVEGRHASLDPTDWQSAEFMRASGWAVVAHTRREDGSVRPGGEWSRSGGTSHYVNQYTVLHPDDHVDEDLLAALVEDELGFTAEQLHSVYCTGGRIPSSLNELRAALDARLLGLAEGGANMDLFGRLMGVNGSTIDRALARARSQEGK